MGLLESVTIRIIFHSKIQISITLISLKGQCHAMAIFWRSRHFLHLLSVLLVPMRWWFSRSFESFYYLIQLLTFYLLHWNYLLILKMLTETLLRIALSEIGRCSFVPTSHWLLGKCARINFSLQLPMWFYRITGCFL